MRKMILTTLLIAVAAGLFLGCQPEEETTGKPENKDVLVVVSPADARSLDPPGNK